MMTPSQMSEMLKKPATKADLLIVIDIFTKLVTTLLPDSETMKGILIENIRQARDRMMKQ